MARRELAASIVGDTVLTVRHEDDGHYTLKVEYPSGGVWETASMDVRDVFTRMGQEVRLLEHQQSSGEAQTIAEQLAIERAGRRQI